MPDKKTVQFPSYNVSLALAIDIVKHGLDNDEIAMQTKVLSIEKIAEMETNNSLTKDELVKALRWIYKHYDLLSVL